MRTPVSWGMGGLACALTLSACTGGSSAGTPPQAASNPPSTRARCDAGPAQSLVGQDFGSDTLARVRAATGAQEARVLSPDWMITKEYKEGRVNVVVDPGQRIVRIHCG